MSETLSILLFVWVVPAIVGVILLFAIRWYLRRRGEWYGP